MIGFRYDAPAYEASRDFLEGRCTSTVCGNGSAAVARVPPLHPTNPAFVATQSDSLNLQPLIVANGAATNGQMFDRNSGRLTMQHHQHQHHSRTHSFAHSYFKEATPIVFQQQEDASSNALPLEKLVYYPIITTDRSNTYVTYYPTHQHQNQATEASEGKMYSSLHQSRTCDIAHSNNMYDSGISAGGITSPHPHSQTYLPFSIPSQQNHHHHTAAAQPQKAANCTRARKSDNTSHVTQSQTHVMQSSLAAAGRSEKRMRSPNPNASQLQPSSGVETQTQTQPTRDKHVEYPQMSATHTTCEEAEAQGAVGSRAQWNSGRTVAKAHATGNVSSSLVLSSYITNRNFVDNIVLAFQVG